MNRLDPKLKRLLTWATVEDAPSLEPVPRDFVNRVVSRWQARPSVAAEEVPGLLSGMACASVVVIVCGVLVWASRPHTSTLAADLSSATQYLARNLKP
jgi:hypothetical protein